MNLTLVNQAVTHLFVGFGLALVNIVLMYFAPWMPRVISILARRNVRTALIAAYLIALVLQLVTSPLFASVLHPVYQELAWSPYEAIFNVLGVLLMDIIYNVWRGVRRGAEVGGKQFAELRTRAATEFDELSDRIIPDADDQAARKQQAADAATKSVTDRKQRIDDRLGDH